jgi:hypothetical protein
VSKHVDPPGKATSFLPSLTSAAIGVTPQRVEVEIHDSSKYSNDAEYEQKESFLLMHDNKAII